MESLSGEADQVTSATETLFSHVQSGVGVGRYKGVSSAPAQRSASLRRKAGPEVLTELEPTLMRDAKEPKGLQKWLSG